jgi:thioredoxin 1
MVKHLEPRESIEDFLSGDGLKMVKFEAQWCGPCKMIQRIIDEIGEEYSDKVSVGVIDIEQVNDYTREMGIRNVPTILYFKNGEIVDRQVGAVPKNVLTQKIENLN